VLHMSTQTDNRTSDKIKFFENLNIKRVILARELSLNQIEKIRKNTSIELEHFISGALCVSYSGQCYMSCYMGGRSANKGVCAQSCRKKYSLVDKSGKTIAKNKYLLSLKDNNLTKHIKELAEAGVKSFKIEGRLKDENYVKNNVLYCHNLMKKFPRTSTGEVVSDFEADISKTFNRSFCDDYLFSGKDNIYNFSTPKSLGEKIGCIVSSNGKNFIIKTKAKIAPQDGLIAITNDGISGCSVNKAQIVKEGVKIYPNKNVDFKKGDIIYRNLNAQFNKILQNSKTVRKLDIDFTVKKDEITIYDENKNKVSYSLEGFEKAKDIENTKKNYVKALSKSGETPFRARNFEFSDELSFVPVSKLNEIRRILIDELTEKILSRYRTKTQKPLNIAKFPLCKGDYRLNVRNEEACEFYELCGCKVEEYALEKTHDFKNKELMRTKHCLKRAFLGCEAKIEKNELFLKDEKGELFPLEFDCKNCEMIVKSPKPRAQTQKSKPLSLKC